jgi:hypothetical protein
MIETGVERSVYPSSFRRRVWSPGVRPGILAGLTPRWTPSMKIAAPAGVVVTERVPPVAVFVLSAAEDPVAGAPSDTDPAVAVPVSGDPEPVPCELLPCEPVDTDPVPVLDDSPDGREWDRVTCRLLAAGTGGYRMRRG